MNSSHTTQPPMTQPEAWTIGRLLTWTADFLKKHGSDSPRLDAELLLAHVRNCRRIELYTAFGDVADDALRTAFREMVRRRSEGTPVAYLVGTKEFYSLPFYVNPDCLIPRPETEHLVIAAIDAAKSLAAAGRTPLAVVDVCTGSGCVAVAFAKHFAAADIVAIDNSPAALAVARRNVETHGLAERVELLEGDLLSELPDAGRYDLILSNPPYVSQAEYETLDKDVREHEPRQALLAGPSGVEVIERLEAQAAGRLTGGGSLIIELSPMIAASVQSHFESAGRWKNVRLIKDLSGRQRVLQATKPNE